MAQNMYRVGDYVYFETTAGTPYQIRKIEELNKNAQGQVEAKVVAFYRRRDIHPALLKIADQADRGNDKAQTVKVERPDSPEDDEEYERKREKHVPLTSKVESVIVAGLKEENGVNGEEKNGERRGWSKEDEPPTGDWGVGGLPKGAEGLSDEKRHKMRQHELFVSRHFETLPATHIRGKCFVTILSEVETVESYDRDDAFFYSLMYDPIQHTILADKGAIRVGRKYQCQIPGESDGEEEEDEKKMKEEVMDKVNNEPEEEMTEEDKLEIVEDIAEMETNLMEGMERREKEREEREEEKRECEDGGDEKEVLVYHPYHDLTDRDIDQFLIVARAVGTFSRALDTSSSSKLPSLHMTAAAASRDVTLFHAMALLHQARYDIGQAVKFLVPPPSKQHYPLDADKSTSHKTVSLGGPILCRDQMEEWSAAEANLFEEAIEKYGKDFTDVRNDFLPWKSIRDIVEYYYMWKTTNRYVDVKKAKNVDHDKLKQVYIPNYNKANTHLIVPPSTSGQPQSGGAPCESCATTLSMSWYSWGPPSLLLRLCSECWSHWKKMGGLKMNHVYDRHDLEGNDELKEVPRQSALTTQSSLQKTAMPRTVPIPAKMLKGAANAKQQRVAFCMRIDPLSKMARRLATKNPQHPKGILNMRRLARKPFTGIDHAVVRQHCHSIEATTQLKTAMGVLKTAVPGNLPTTLIHAISSNTLFSAPKRPSGSNGADALAPPAKRANMDLA